MVLSLDPKGVQGFRGARAAPAGPCCAYSLTFEAARCDVNVATLLALIIGCNLPTTVQQGRVVLYKVLFQSVAYVRTTCCLPFPQRSEGRRGQGSSHTLPQSLPSPSRLLLSSDNICTPKFIKSMTLFLSARLDYIYLTCPRALSLSLYFLCKRETTKGGFHRLVLHDLFLRHKKRRENRREIEYTPALLYLFLPPPPLGSNGTRQRQRLARERARGLAAHGPRYNDEGVALYVG